MALTGAVLGGRRARCGSSTSTSTSTTVLVVRYSGGGTALRTIGGRHVRTVDLLEMGAERGQCLQRVDIEKDTTLLCYSSPLRKKDVVRVPRGARRPISAADIIGAIARPTPPRNK